MCVAPILIEFNAGMFRASSGPETIFNMEIVILCRGIDSISDRRVAGASPEAPIRGSSSSGMPIALLECSLFLDRPSGA